MDMIIIGSVIVLLGTFLIVALLALRSRAVFKIAFRNFVKRKRSTVFAVFGLAVGAAIVTGSLAVGDSLTNAVVRSTYENLGEVDEAVRSVGVFNISVVDAISSPLADELDAVAPLIVMPVSVKDVNTGTRQSLVNIIAFESSFSDFGEFKLGDGSVYTGTLGANQALINRKLAERLRASESDLLTVSFRTPEFSFETVYSPITSLLQWNFTVSDIVENTGLGRFQLSSSGVVPENMFVRLDTLQEIMGLESKVNTVIVSNEGDRFEGLEQTRTVTQMLKDHFDEHMGFEDLGFHIATDDYVKMDRREIFFEERYLNVVRNITSDSPLVDGVSELTSYFFNWAGNETSFVAYSVATGLDPVMDSEFGLFERSTNSEQIVGELAGNEAIINEFVANKLGIGEGSPITLNYSVYDDTFNEVYKHEDFTVKYIINLTGKADDSEVMPPFPGIKGKASCGEWDPPIPIDVQGLMDWDDLDYWITYGGSPKVYITLDKAKELWANDLGDITTIKIKPSAGTNTTMLAQFIGAELNNSIGYADAGITISPIKQEGIDSAQGVQIVTETYIAFGSVVILAGMLLIVLFVATTAEERKREIGVLRTLGATRKKTTLAFAFEGSLLAIIASAIGVMFGFLVAAVSVWMTNAYWSNIVEGNEIVLHISIPTVFLGILAGFLIAFITYAIASYSISGMRIVEALRKVRFGVVTRSGTLMPRVAVILGGILFVIGQFFFDSSTGHALLVLSTFLLIVAFGFEGARRVGRLFLAYVGVIGIASILGLNVFFLWMLEEPAFIPFFVSGFVVVLSAGVIVYAIIPSVSKALGQSSVTRIAFSSPERKPGLSTMTIIMFAIVVFTLVALAVNISGQQANIDRAVVEQSGGYQVLVEATTPIRFDLGDATERFENNVSDFPVGTSVAQFSTFGSPGGTCSNLNSDLPPRLIGANSTFLQENSFIFSSSKDHQPTDSEGAWSELEVIYSDGSIPIVGDTNTIVWIYGKGVGDSIEITDESGQRRSLIVTGILRSSMFSGSVFLSEDNLDDLFPTKAEYNLFLFRTDQPEVLAANIEDDMDSYGADATLVEDRVREDLEIEWSYMSLFQTLLMFGLVVGTAGLALTAAKSVSERKQEIGILRSLGFTRGMVLSAFLLENLYISLSGTLIGVVFGLVVSFVFFGPVGGQGYGVVVPWLTIVVIILAVFLATILSTAGPAIRAGRLRTVDALRVEE